jgi:hypothetical protein
VGQVPPHPLQKSLFLQRVYCVHLEILFSSRSKIDEPADIEIPSTPPQKHLTRDERLQIRTLFYVSNWSYAQISEATGATIRQIGHAIKTGATPKKRYC